MSSPPPRPLTLTASNADELREALLPSPYDGFPGGWEVLLAAGEPESVIEITATLTVPSGKKVSLVGQLSHAVIKMASPGGVFLVEPGAQLSLEMVDLQGGSAQDGGAYDDRAPPRRRRPRKQQRERVADGGAAAFERPPAGSVYANEVRRMRQPRHAKAAGERPRLPPLAGGPAAHEYETRI